MKKLFQRFRWLYYVEAVLLIVMGVLIICFNANESLHAAIGYIIAIYLLMNAIFVLSASIALNLPILDANFITGLILLTISIWLFAEPTLFINALPLIIGVASIGVGIVVVGQCSMLFVTLGSTPRRIVYFVCGILLFVFGITIISLNYSGSVDFSDVILLILGILLLIDGIGILVDAIRLTHATHKIKKDADDNVIEAEIKEEK